jgi:hypothetical protein
VLVGAGLVVVAGAWIAARAFRARGTPAGA